MAKKTCRKGSQWAVERRSFERYAKVLLYCFLSKINLKIEKVGSLKQNVVLGFFGVIVYCVNHFSILFLKHFGLLFPVGHYQQTESRRCFSFHRPRLGICAHKVRLFFHYFSTHTDIIFSSDWFRLNFYIHKL